MSVGSPARPRGTRWWARTGLDRFELATLAAFLALSVAVLAGQVLRVWLKGGLVTGTDGFYAVDQLQYLNWIRQAGEHVAITNLYDLAPGSRSFVHPGVLVSGLLHSAGLGLVASYALWKPVAVVAVFAGSLLYVRRFLTDRGDRRLALVLALFALPPVAAAIHRADVGSKATQLRFDFLAGEMWSGTYLWGYLFTALAVGLLPLALLAYERGRAGGSSRMLGWTAAAGLLCSWLQPWQGATLAIVMVAAELVCVRRGERTVRQAASDLAVPLAAIAAPLLYYFVLSQADASWELADRANDQGARWPVWVVALGLAPLALPALLAYRLPARDFGAVALRAWPLAVLLVFYQPAGTFPPHAFQGLTLPLVVLGVLALRDRLGARPLAPALAVGVVLAFVVPGTVDRADIMRKAVNLGFQPFFLEDDEHDALEELDRIPERGGVLAPYYSGQLVPAYTGRETWVGAVSWTPDFYPRARVADRLFSGKLGPAGAERLVRTSGARFVYSDCQGRANIERAVAGFTDPPRRFGCATVYRVRDPGG